MSSPAPIHLTVFAHAFDGMPKPRNTTWGEFVESLGPHAYTADPDKRNLPMFSPAEFRAGLPRTGKNVVRVWFGVLDLDKINAAQVGSVVAKIQAQALDAVLYTTFSHASGVAAGLWRIRVCVRLSRPIEPVEWDSFWSTFVAYFGNLADAQTKDINRAYFGPSVIPGTDPSLCWFIPFHGGQPLDVSSLAVQAYGAPPVQATEKIGRERLERLGSRWRKSRDHYRSEMGAVLGQLVKGEPFAEPGNRDTIAFQLCSDLAKALPAGSPESIALHFAPSLQRMGKDAPTLENIQDKLRRAQEAAAGEAYAAEQATINEAKLRIRQAFAHIDPTRDTAYTEPELDEMAESCKCSRDELRKRWLIQRGALFYCLGPGGVYSPAYSDKDILNAILRDLAPAVSAGVDLWTELASGEKARKNMATIMGEFGTVATDYVLDLRAQVATYDSASKLFVEAPTPVRRELVPVYDHQVAGWLEVLAGDNIGDLLNWIANVTDLWSICAALMLTGAPGTGKTLLAYGLARIWSTNQPTELESALSNFNDSISRCPLILGDEQLPKDFRGNGRTAELRQFIAALSRPHKKKFAPETSILGAIRLIITANNEGILTMADHLSKNDIEAIGDRFYHIRVPESAAEYLKGIDTRRLVQGDAIARHALYLRDYYPKRRDGRFMIKSPDREFYRGLATKTGIRSAILQWCAGYLKNPRPIDSSQTYGVRVKTGRLYITSVALADKATWETYVQNEPVPPTGRLAQAIGELSDDRVHMTRPSRAGGSAHYRAVDKAHLYAWASQTEYATRDELDAALAIDTETRIAQAQGKMS